MTTVTCVLNIRSVLGESPMWHAGERRLYWIDLLKPAIYRFDPATGRNGEIKAELGSYIGGLVFRAKGGVVIVNETGLHTLDNGRLTPLVDPEPDKPGNWFNDAKCDRQGNLWAGTGDRDYAAPTGTLYRFRRDLGFDRIDSDFACPNGPAFSPDGTTVYFCDGTSNTILAYGVDAKTGRVGPRRVFAAMEDPAFVPDGMTVDSEGYLWSAQWDGWRVVRYAPDGRIDRVVKLPVPRPTAMAFGGENLDTLYITSASTGLGDADLAKAPLSGSLFAVKPGVRGLPEPSFVG